MNFLQKIGIVFGLLVISMIALMVWLTWFGARMRSRRFNALHAKLAAISGFPQPNVLVGEGSTGIAIDRDARKLALVRFLRSGPELRVLGGSELIAVQLFEDGQLVTETVRGTQVKGAVIGGLAFGVPGAIIGGLSAKTRTTNEVTRIELRLTVNDAANPIHDVPLLTTQTTKGSLTYNQAMKVAREWAGRMEVIMRRADTATHTSSREVRGRYARR